MKEISEHIKKTAHGGFFYVFIAPQTLITCPET
jgi:hypothetical protein